MSFAIFTDIDDTLVDRAGAPRLMAATQRVRALATQHNWPLIVVTGLDIHRVTHRVRTGGLPQPDIAVCGVGTEVWHYTNGRFANDSTYQAILATKGYDRAHIFKGAQTAINDYARTAPSAGLHLETPQRDHEYKVTLNFFGTEDDAIAIGHDFNHRFPGLKIVICKEIHHNATLPPDATVLKHCLDIVAANKADALEYLIKKLGITSGIKAGDSGNDTDMLLHNDPLLGVLVGGYKPEAAASVRRYIPNSQPGPMQTLADGRLFYIEDGPRRGPQSILHAIGLLKD